MCKTDKTKHQGCLRPWDVPALKKEDKLIDNLYSSYLCISKAYLKENSTKEENYTTFS